VKLPERKFYRKIKIHNTVLRRMSLFPTVLIPVLIHSTVRPSNVQNPPHSPVPSTQYGTGTVLSRFGFFHFPLTLRIAFWVESGCVFFGSGSRCLGSRIGTDPDEMTRF